ncbi:unnamed protein product [marine sediment metagenome]|uniref:Uncharacterized protein n=1 Tax=marine sediment metagenome TaxID=412755 RepID=X1Q650_9ZZZZ
MRGKISSPAISGVITLFSVPTTLQVGNEIRVNIDGDLYDYDKAWYEPWYGCFTVERAGYHNYATFDGFGVVIGPEWAPTIGLGPMPDTTVLVTARLWAQPSAWAGTGGASGLVRVKEEIEPHAAHGTSTASGAKYSFAPQPGQSNSPVSPSSAVSGYCLAAVFCATSPPPPSTIALPAILPTVSKAPFIS